MIYLANAYVSHPRKCLACKRSSETSLGESAKAPVVSVVCISIRYFRGISLGRGHDRQ